MLHLAQAEESVHTPISEVQTPPVSPDITSTQENEEPRVTVAPPPSIIPSRDAESEPVSGRESPLHPPESPHKEFHCAVLKALGCDTELTALTRPEPNGPDAGTACDLSAEDLLCGLDFESLSIFHHPLLSPGLKSGDPAHLYCMCPPQSIPESP